MRQQAKESKRKKEKERYVETREREGRGEAVSKPRDSGRKKNDKMKARQNER